MFEIALPTVALPTLARPVVAPRTGRDELSSRDRA